MAKTTLSVKGMICQVEGCERDVKARGYCKSHHYRAIQDGTIELLLGRKECKVDGCEGVVLARGYCSRHYHQLMDYGKVLKRTVMDPNEITVEGDVAKIQLYNKQCQKTKQTIIDAEDVDKVKDIKWRLTKNAVCGSKGPSGNVCLSRFLMDCTDDSLFVDHKNHDTIDNRKQNLRICTMEENNRNVRTLQKTKTDVKGVWPSQNGNRYMAGITVDKKFKYLGYHETIDEAAVAYNNAAEKYFGEFACLNEV